MAESITIARPYAKAAFHVAKESDALSAWSDMLSVASSVANEDSMSEVIDHPALTAEQKVDIFAEVCGDSLNASGKNFLSILSDNDRLSVLPEIANLFEDFKAQLEQSVDVEIETAFELGEAQETALTQALEKNLERKVVISSSTNSALIGGAIIRASDLVIDASLKGKIAKLADSIKT